MQLTLIMLQREQTHFRTVVVPRTSSKCKLLAVHGEVDDAYDY